MWTVIVMALGAVAGWIAAERGVIEVARPFAAVAGGVGALVFSVLLNLLLSVVWTVLGALIGAGVALWLIKVAFDRR